MKMITKVDSLVGLTLISHCLANVVLVRLSFVAQTKLTPCQQLLTCTTLSPSAILPHLLGVYAPSLYSALIFKGERFCSFASWWEVFTTVNLYRQVLESFPVKLQTISA